MRRNVRRLNREVQGFDSNNTAKNPTPKNPCRGSKSSSVGSRTAKERNQRAPGDRKKARGRKAANLAELQR